jgi:hypothetical protein
MERKKIVFRRKNQLRSLSDAEWYWYKKALDCILEYLHKGKDLNSAFIEDDRTSVQTETLEGFQKFVCQKITEYEAQRGSNKFGKWS